MRLSVLAVLLAACWVLWLPPRPLAAAEDKAFEVKAIRLYQPEEELTNRIGKDVAPLADYIKALQKSADTFWSKAEKGEGQGLLVVVAVKPGKKARVWCESVGGKVPRELLEKCEKELAKVEVPPVEKGPVAFALETLLWGGGKVDKFPELPQTWSDAAKDAKKPLRVPDEVLKHLWPD